ncbi:MDIS1-interacting receptor like kinase 2-like protein [Cinnamomum micranthum f. kanehirae]|uniref:non-specific serine/threonine protein kinase n=1 Tax=Cinnamomum micranthum f. kanehirae TaxID=337451 RepID=A0A443Q2L5_9MAGN|nr:MDIS1-interacting receptor like kinase 2-like protein [Cinnamomum micranthum f. kanehirae]
MCHTIIGGSLPDNKAFLNASLEALSKNKGLCGEVQGLRTMQLHSSKSWRWKKDHKGAGVIVLSLIRRSTLPFCFVWNNDGKIIYEEIIDATEDFDEKFCVGEGGYGKVYRANLHTGQVVAVKKLHPQEDGEQIDKEVLEMR